MSKPTSETHQINGYLTLGIPAVVLVLLFKTTLPWLLVLAGGVGGWRFWRAQQQREQDKQTYLDRVFYQLLLEHQGRITPLDLAMKTRLPSSDIQPYLDQKAVEFSAQFEVTDQGGVLYYFQTVQALTPEMKTVGFEGQPVEELSLQLPKEIALFPLPAGFEGEKDKFPPPYLNQSELAKRFQVHPNTLSRWKTRPQFQQWSALKDPAAIAWSYSSETKYFSPVVKQENSLKWKKWFRIDS
ncbi:MAG: hypothetical protein ACRC8A_11660 [Microcoleaceae cyanobacterium]